MNCVFYCLLGLCLGASLSGCQRSAPERSFQVHTEVIADEAEMKLVRIQITFQGDVGIRASHRGDFGGGASTVYYRDQQPSLPRTVFLNLNATEIPVPGEKPLIRLARTSVQVDRCGGPTVRQLREGESVREAVRLTVRDGSYPIGKTLEIGQLLDQKIELLVAPVEVLEAESPADPRNTPAVHEPVRAVDAINNYHS